jgi:Piwi domain
VVVQSFQEMAEAVLGRFARAEADARYKKLTPEQLKKVPTRNAYILYYRDGVSEGQFDHVRSVEVRLLRAAARAVFPGMLVKVTCIVVKKRHHTRLFTTHDPVQNVPPGEDSARPPTALQHLALGARL